jgi:hypothetical protein
MSKKIITLDSTGAGMVVRSPKLPAEKPPFKWRDFDRFVRDADELHQYVDGLNTLRFASAVHRMTTTARPTTSQTKRSIAKSSSPNLRPVSSSSIEPRLTMTIAR